MVFFFCQLHLQSTADNVYTYRPFHCQSLVYFVDRRGDEAAGKIVKSSRSQNKWKRFTSTSDTTAVAFVLTSKRQ